MEIGKKMNEISQKKVILWNFSKKFFPIFRWFFLDFFEESLAENFERMSKKMKGKYWKNWLKNGKLFFQN